MNKEQDSKLIKQTNEQENKDIKDEIKEKKKHTGLKIAASVGGALVVGGIAASALLPNVNKGIVNGVEDLIYNVTDLSFDINGDFNPGGESFYAVYGPAEPPSYNETTDGVDGF